MRQIQPQRDQWPHRIAELRRQADDSQSGGNGTTFTDTTSSQMMLNQMRTDWATSMGQSAAGDKYELGGAGPGSTNVLTHQPAKSTDCSGLVGDALNIYRGGDPNGEYLKDSTGERFNTTSDMAAMGLKPGYQPGALNIGVNPKPGTSGHMDVQLPNGQGMESSGSGGVEFGSGAAPVTIFPQQWHMPGTQLPPQASGATSTEQLLDPTRLGLRRR